MAIGSQGLERIAAERLTGVDDRQLENMVSDVAVGQMRMAVAEREAAEMTKHPDKLAAQFAAAIGEEVGKLGLEVVNFKVERVVETR